MAQEYVRHYEALSELNAGEAHAGYRPALSKNSVPDRLPAK
jgi:hypothetical protein